MAAERSGDDEAAQYPAAAFGGNNTIAGNVFGQVVQIGVLNGDVNLVAGTPVRTRYHEQVGQLAPLDLLGREQELAELGQFCTDPATAGRYLWWRAKAWSGKSALLSWFVLHPPPRVRIVSFFITARLASQNDRAAFIENLLEQLLAVLQQSLPPFLTDTTREAHLLGLLADTAQGCLARGEQFVLVVDGLDEDRGAHSGDDWHSIANLLPATPPAGMRVIVASRTDPPLPGDVPSDHPLRDPGIQRVLSASPHAHDLREQMERDLISLLRGAPLGRDLLGLAVAASGALSDTDLMTLTNCEPWEVREYLKTVAGRSFTRRASHYRSDTTVYVLAHEDLHEAACDQFGAASLAGYRDRLHQWAQDYCDGHWPKATPDYLLRGYPDMLAQAGDLSRLVACVIDRDRQERLLLMSGGDSAALAEIVKAIDLCAAAPTIDLNVIVRLARHRERLRVRNTDIPVVIPATWARLDEIDRAVQIARSITAPIHQVFALARVAEVVAQAGNRDRAVALLHEAEDTAGSTIDFAEQANALAETAQVAARVGDLDRAERIARSITDPEYRASALARVAEVVAQAGSRDRAAAILHDAEHTASSITSPEYRASAVAKIVAQAGDLDRAEAIARSITEPDQQVMALAAVAPVVAQAGDLDRAERIAHSITSSYYRASALAAVAPVVAQAGDLDRAERIARSITAPDEPVWALAKVAEVVALAGDRDRAVAILHEAEHTAHLIPDPGRRASALAKVAGVVALAGDRDRAVAILHEAEHTARPIIDPYSLAYGLRSVAEVFLRVGDLDQAARIARSITLPRRRAWELAEVAEVVSLAGEHERAVALLHEAEHTARPISDPDRPEALRWMADAVALAGDLDRAERIARSITSPERQGWAQRTVVKGVARAGDLDRAERIARSIIDAEQRALALADVAQATAWAGDLDRAERIARSVAEPVWQMWALAEVTTAVTLAGDLDRAEHIACSIPDSYHRKSALHSVAMGFARAGDRRRAEYIARSITDPDRQRWTLESVAETMARAGEFDQAEYVARSITDPDKQRQAMLSVAQVVGRAGDPDRAEHLARSITGSGSQARTLNAISDGANTEQILRDVARKLKSAPWYQSSSDVLSMATDAFDEAVDELCTDSPRSGHK